MAIECDFFIKLASRFWQEPKLSDIIWAMCCSNTKFQNIFLEYCFDEEITIIGEMKREYRREHSIPDFYFEDVNNEYIIENKKYDRVDHFEQYKITFPNAKRAFIANYIEPDHDGWKVKTWKKFVLFIENKMDEFQENEKNFVTGFICYLKSILNYVEAKSMDLSNISSLYSFFIVLEEVVSECQLVKLSEYDTTLKVFDRRYHGKYFTYLNDRQEVVYIWLGLYMPDQSGVNIVFRLYQDDNWLPKKERCIIEKLTVGKYFDNVRIEDGNVYIHLKDEYFSKLCSKNDIMEQKNIIKNFLEEIVALIIHN